MELEEEQKEEEEGGEEEDEDEDEEEEEEEEEDYGVKAPRRALLDQHFELVRRGESREQPCSPLSFES